MYNVTNKAPYRIEYSGGWATVDLFVQPAYESGTHDALLARAIVREGLLRGDLTGSLMLGGHPVYYCREQRTANHDVFFARVRLPEEELHGFLEHIDNYHHQAQTIFTAEMERIISLVRTLSVIRSVDWLRELAGLTKQPSRKEKGHAKADA